MSINLKELIAATTELQSLPSTTMRLVELLDDVTADAAAVLDVVEKDPSLTSNMLKLANSAYYGLSRQVGTVREALIMLGNQAVVNLAFAASMGDILRGPLAAYRLPRNNLWHHALAVGLGAANLASAGGDRELRERAFTGGLVHDIGKLILNRPLKEELEALPEDIDFESLLAAERSILGFNHAKAGAALAESWNFPKSLAGVIRYHHRPAGARVDGDLVRAVAAANLAACQVGFGGGTVALSDEVFWASVEELGIPADHVGDLLTRLPRDLENMLNLTGDTLK